ncbi:ABC transporter [Nonomuraea terrae]|uniref:ABC transporter n=1 Tax=Nonomuraea terrae TaxID=2530383 RepID=A0A4R4YG73_9ACTN|nr:YfjP family GTPase [Nonomuraea terrae]TDD42232.1 ABC transporter [Nonomuraea terrae]
MKLLRRKEGPSLDARVDALLEAASLGEGRLSEQAVSAARAVAERAGARRGLSIDHTVAALAGATGSGKSSLFNALAGDEVAAVGVTRPTTSTAQAVLWDGEGAGPLLDWLDIPQRHSARSHADTGTPDMSGLVLLDLPDHDSIRLSHRLEVDRLVELVDLLVWVVDPQKYADAALHERYLRPLAAHRDVMLVVLNQVDRLPAQAVDRCLRDMRRLLDGDGLTDVPVIAVSARTGQGMDDLRKLLGDRVAQRTAWSARLAADVTTAAAHLTTAGPAAPEPEPVASGGVLTQRRAEPVGEGVTPQPAGEGKRLEGAGRALTGALCAAAGVPIVVEAVAKGHRHRAVVATGWPVTRWVRRFRPDPLRRLRIGVAPTTKPELPARAKQDEKPVRVSVPGGDAGRAAAPERVPGGIVGRTSVPAASVVQRAQVETAIRDVGEVAASGLPGPWAASVRQAARSHARELADAVDRVVATTSAGATKRPRWWRAVNVLQWLVFAAMLAGVVWLGILFAVDYLRLPEPPVPTAGEVPWPTVLLLGGVAAGVLIALLSRLTAWAGGARRARRTAKALRTAIDQVGAELVLEPVKAELETYDRFTDALTRARA